MDQEYEDTLNNLNEQVIEARSLLKWISNIVETLISGELTLQDIIAEEESLDNRCYELQEVCKKIIRSRQFLDLCDDLVHCCH